MSGQREDREWRQEVNETLERLLADQGEVMGRLVTLERVLDASLLGLAGGAEPIRQRLAGLEARVLGLDNALGLHLGDDVRHG
jgi:hypothetical protein